VAWNGDVEEELPAANTWMWSPAETRILADEGDQVRLLMGPLSCEDSFTTCTVCRVSVDRIIIVDDTSTATSRPLGLGLQRREA
jgi:hypothetical protein